MDAAGVDRAVIVMVPPSWEGDRNDLEVEATKHYLERFLAAARLDIEALEASTTLRKWRDTASLKAVRVGFHCGRYRAMQESEAID